MEARLADVDDQADLLGHLEDVFAICGSRMYVFFLDAAPTERLLSQTGSLLTMGAENGGKLRASILTLEKKRKGGEKERHPKVPLAGIEPATDQSASPLCVFRLQVQCSTTKLKWQKHCAQKIEYTISRGVV